METNVDELKLEYNAKQEGKKSKHVVYRTVTDKIGPIIFGTRNKQEQGLDVCVCKHLTRALIYIIVVIVPK